MKQIQIVPLSTPQTITRAAWKAVSEAKRLFLQTDRHPCANPVKEAGLSYETMDDLYETADDFDALNAAIAERLLAAGDCVYAVPGDGCFAQTEAIRAACEAQDAAWSVLPGVSYAKAAFPALQSARLCTANSLPNKPDPAESLCIQEIDTWMAAGEVKLYLQRFYPDELPVSLASMQPDGSYRIETIPLDTLDRRTDFFAGSVLLVPPVPFFERTKYLYDDLCAILERLRAPGGCPWDREQTHESIKRDLIEECYELCDAIDEQDDAHIIEELGDVLMQVVFHATIAKEQGRFDEDDVSDGIVKKLIYRHPHVFGDVTATTAGEVLKTWEALKAAERHQTTQTEAMCSVPKRFPALIRSAKVQKKARKVGFDWKDAEEAFPKIAEETAELHEAMRMGSNVGEEAGDLLFAVVNVVRLLGLDAEQLLHEATDKFVDRFGRMEQLVLQDGKQLADMTLAEQDAYWERVKHTPPENVLSSIVKKEKFS
ncbi:MAG: nucleoside triphosphate pyrophosphohydrolase [Clostridia bacterium]|nr:nucleoside triphosphate pyrophosphohydrolase [Clostridia bacterium]